MWHALDDLWGKTLKQDVINNGGTLVIRPDSGDPVAIVCQTLEKLISHFGCHTNSKGYRMLPDYLRVIQGDGVSASSIRAILTQMQLQGLSTDNVSFGMGAELLQNVNLDTLCFAMKASAVKRNHTWHDVFKAPVTDTTKSSKRGRLALIQHTSGDYETIAEQDLRQQVNCLLPVFREGQLLIHDNFTNIRQRADRYQIF